MTETEETKRPVPVRKHPFAPFHEEILAKVIAPRIAETVAQGGGSVTNRAELHRKFNEQHGTTVSYSTFSDWCEELDIKFETRIHVEIPGYRSSRMSVPARPVQFEAPSEMDMQPEQMFDNVPRQSAAVPIHFALGERDILPGGIPAPVMMDREFGNQ